MSSIQNFFTSRDNNANASTYVGQLDRLWYDPITNTIYVSDGVTPGGIAVSGGGGGNGTPSGPNQSVQFNDNGVFGGNASLTYDAANATLRLTGNVQANNVTASTLMQANVIASNNGLFLNANVILENYTLPTGFNAMSAGPMEVVNGANVGVPNGQRWTIV